MTAALTVMVLAAGSAAAPPLTEEQAVALALQNSPRIRQQGHAVEEAQAVTEASLAWKNPLLRLGGVRYDDVLAPAIERRDYDDHPLGHATIGLRWSPPGLGERAAVRAEGQAREAEARARLTVARREMTARVRTLHAQIVSFDAQLALLRDGVATREQLCLLVERRLELQAATAVERSLAEVDYLDARTLLSELEIRRRAAYDELLIELGLPAGSEVALASAPATCTAADVAMLATRAQAVNPRLRVQQAELAAVAAERRRRRLERVPWLDYVQVAYGFAGGQRADFIALQLQLTLPLLDLKRPQLRALAAREQALADGIALDQRVLGERVVRGAAGLAEQAALMARYRDAAAVVERGVNDLRAALAASGPTRLAEVVALQARLLTTQRAYLRAQLDCKLQQIELDQLTTGDRERDQEPWHPERSEP